MARSRKDESPEMAELQRLAEDALREHPEDFFAAAGVFHAQVEDRLDLVKALVTERELHRLSTAFLSKVQLSAVGRTLHTGRGRVPPGEAEKETEEQARERWRLLGAEMRSVLWTFRIGGKALAICTRAEVEQEYVACGRRTTFLKKVLEVLPKNPDVIVRDVVTAAAAAEFWTKGAAA